MGVNSSWLVLLSYIKRDNSKSNLQQNLIIVCSLMVFIQISCPCLKLNTNMQYLGSCLLVFSNKHIFSVFYSQFIKIMFKMHKFSPDNIKLIVNIILLKKYSHIKIKLSIYQSIYQNEVEEFLVFNVCSPLNSTFFMIT